MTPRCKKLRNRTKSRLRTKFRGLIERLEERLPLTGPYVNTSLSEENLLAIMEGSRGITGLGDRIDQSGYHAQPLAPLKNQDGTAFTPGQLGPFGRTAREAIENPISEYYSRTPPDQRSTDSLIAHLGSDPAFLSIEGGLIDGTIDELVFDIHIRREYELDLVDIEFEIDNFGPFDTKHGAEVNLTAVVEYQAIFGVSLDPTLNVEQAFFVRESSLFTSIRVDQVLHPLTVDLGIIEASVPDVTISGSVDIAIGQPAATPSLRMTEINTLEVDELFTTTLGDNDFNATFNLDVGVGTWRLAGPTFLQTAGDWLGFDPSITFSPNFDEVFLFGNISSGEIVAGMENFQAWLTSLSNTSDYNLPIPMTSSATIGSAMDLGQGMSRFTESLRDEDGFPSFENAQDFPYSRNGIDYNESTNKILFTIAQNLPRQELESRATRILVDDTLGLDSNVEATITGEGTLNVVISIDLSEDSAFNRPPNVPVTFLDRVSVETLSIGVGLQAEANLTGNAAFGGLGLAFGTAVLSGEFSTDIALADGLRPSLRTLQNSLNDLDSIFVTATNAPPIDWDGSISMRVSDLSVMGSLFSLASDAFVEVSVNDIAGGDMETNTNAPDLLNFEGISFEGLTDTLGEVLLGTQNWDSEGDAAVATLGVSLDDFGPLKQDRIVAAIDEAMADTDTSIGLARNIVQDIPGFVENLTRATASGTYQFVSRMSYHAANRVLQWSVEASAEETSDINVGLGFESLHENTGDGKLSDTDDLVGERSSLPATSFSRLILGMEFDPASSGIGARSLPGSYLTNESRLERTLFVNATPAAGSPVRIEGASGAMGMTLRNGSVIVAQNLATPDPTAPAQFFSTFPVGTSRVLVSDLATFVPARTTLGRLRADFQVVPDHTGNPEPSRLTFRVNNFNNPANSTTLISSPDFPVLRQGLNLQVNMDALADSMDEWFKKVGERVAEEVLGKAYPLIGDKLEQFTNFIEELRQKITTVIDGLSSITDIETAIEDAIWDLIDNIVPPPPRGDYFDLHISSPTQVKFTLDIDGAPISSRKVVETDLGVPALGVDWVSDIEVIGSYDFEATFVMDVNEGFYVETNSEHIGLFFDANVFGQATGKLGFFEVIATAAAPAPGQSVFEASYTIDLTEPSGDDKLFLREIGTGPLINVNTSGLAGEAHMSFTIEAGVNDWLPSIRTGLRIDWEFEGIGFSGNNPPEVTYEGVQLDLGRLLDEVFLPFFESIQKVFDPFSSAIDFLTDPLPVLRELTSPPASIIRLAEEFAKTLPADSDLRKSIESLSSFIKAIDTINDIVKSIKNEKGNGLLLELGDIAFGGSRSPQFDARRDQLDKSVVNEANTASNLRSQFDLGAKDVAKGLNSSPGSLKLPIIEDPLSTIGWILGVGEANLITWDLPDVVVNFPVDFSFNIFPGILAGIFGGLEIGTNLKVGLDTAGFEAYSKSRDVKDLFQGFYVSDRANADGTGADTNELYVRGELFAGAGVGVEILGVAVKLIVGGGVFSEFGLDLVDQDKDGKVRGHDFSAPGNCFALTGEMGVGLEAKAKAGIFKAELPIAEVTLLKGRKEFACPFYEEAPPKVIAGVDASGTLTLYMGPNANLRNVSKNVEKESFKVEQTSTHFIVSAFGVSQSFEHFQNGIPINKIFADGGTDDDRIELVNVGRPSELFGGDGDDVIIGGEIVDTIDGGLGDDELYGNGGDDVIRGNFGDDILHGDAGNDDLFGNEDFDTIFGGADDDEIDTGDGLNTAYGDGGVDIIIGGSLRDRLYGGDDGDTIEGRGGDDVIYGDAGVDILRGEEGNDTIDGGSDGDSIFGDSGEDRLFGRGGVDTIDGGIGDDFINGGDDGDYLYGRRGRDEIVGEGGDDTIEGGLGEDLIYGDGALGEIEGGEDIPVIVGGIDTIEGGEDRDLIYGGDADDTINGGDGDDEIYGEAGYDTISGKSGNDLLIGGAGGDTIYGGTGNDIIEGDGDHDFLYGYESNLLADSLPVGITDVDVIRGGRGSDRIAGGPHDDLLYGEQDQDIIIGNEGADTIEGNDGLDTLYGFHFLTFWSPVQGGVDLPNRLVGNKDDDEIHGGPNGDYIRGHAGNDLIFGHEGPDEIFGDADNDVIDGGDDIDMIDGGTGNDFISGNGEDDFLYGNNGLDIIHGNLGKDFIAGNDQADSLYGEEDNDLVYGGNGPDFVYGDAGDDNIYGGDDNDTLRGGNDNDTIYGEEGDDLIIGHQGVDTLYGDDGDDLIYGGTQVDTIYGNAGNDRIYGELGEDILFGNEGDDIIEGGASNDTLSGDDGNDVLYGDDGEDTIHGGRGNDTLFAGAGVSNQLNGDEGNDTLIGSDDGDEDPKFGDTTFFGDRLNGGDGDDSIDGLGGADVIDGGTGVNSIRGGTHLDSVVNGVDGSIAGVPFAMPTGPDRRGPWSELSRSASLGGLTNVGGMEEAVWADPFGVYVAWVDWRNGNSEIYVAYHPNGVGDWTPLVGFNGGNSASGGGISNDELQSRRPTLFKTEDSDSLVVAWTSIAPDGTSNIEVAREDTNWTRIINPGQTGSADNARFVQFADLSGLLFWMDGSSGLHRVNVSQYIHATGCFEGFAPAREVIGIPFGEEVKDYDVAAVEFQAVIAMTYGTSSDQDIKVLANGSSIVGASQLCPAIPGASVTEYASGNWRELHVVADGDTENPAIGIQYIRQRGFVKGEIELEYDVALAWEWTTERENQVDGLVIHVPLDGPIAIQPMLPEYRSDNGPRVHAETISDTRGYAAKPDISMTYSATTLGWMDDGIFLGDNRSRIFVLSRFRDTAPGDYVLREQEPSDASGSGISETGGSLRELTLMAHEDGFSSSNPYALWSEAATPTPSNSSGVSSRLENVYLRVNLPGLQAVDDVARVRKFGRFNGNVLTNDINVFGEIDGYVSMFNSHELIPGDVLMVEITSPLGVKVSATVDGTVTYNPRGVPAFKSLKRGESLSESFVYRVNNGIHEAEGVVEFVVFGTNAWRNERNHMDVDDDTSVSPLDVLALVNDLNQNGARELDDIGPGLKRFLDVDDDGSISALDVLTVINWLNGRSLGGGEGEGPSTPESESYLYAAMGYTDDVWTDWTDASKTQRRGVRRV